MTIEVKGSRNHSNYSNTILGFKMGFQKIVGGIGSRSAIKYKHVKVGKLVILAQKVKVCGK